MRPPGLSWLALALAIAACGARAPGRDIVGVASVRDGDSLEIHGEPIRLFGVDAPESRQLCQRAGSSWRCGVEAARALSDRIGRRTVTCVARDRDRYGRTVAVCRVDGDDLSAWMVREGWAFAYRRYATDYVAAEREARAARRGIWDGTVDAPWDWRARRRAR